jgi:tetratricopeptide (TPR) repeat protein
VVSFENQTGDGTYDYLSKVIPNLLITNLEQSGYFNVTTWERIRDLLKQAGQGDTEFIGSDLGFELCQSDGVEVIVLGLVSKSGNTFVTDAKVMDVGSKKLLGTASSGGDSADSIFKNQIDEISRQIAKSVGLSERRIEAAKLQVREVTTGSADAYAHYLKGRETLTNFEFSQKATERERLLIEAQYASSVEKDFEKRLRILKEAEEKYPKDKDIHSLLALAYSERGMYEQAIEENNKVLALDPNNPDALNDVAYAYMALQDFDKAVESLKKYAAALPGKHNPFDSLAEAYFRMGKLDEAVENYKEALEAKPDYYPSMKSLAYMYALREDYVEALRWTDKYLETAPIPGVKLLGYLLKGFYWAWLGSTERSSDFLQRADDLAEALGAKRQGLTLSWLRLWISYDRKEFDAGRKYANAWKKDMAENFPQDKEYYEAVGNFALGLMDLDEGRLDPAKSCLKEIESLLPHYSSSMKEYLEWLHRRLCSEILLAEGLLSKAKDACEKKLSEPPPYFYSNQATEILYNTPFLQDVLGRIYVKMGNLDKAVAEYERLTNFDPRDQSRYLIHPLYHYRLAKLYDQKGLKDKARSQYERFLDLWKDADPGLPEVEEAQRRLNALN